MRGYKSRNTYTISGTVGGFYLKPTDVKLSFYQAKDGTVVPKLHGVQQDEKLLQRPFHEHDFTKQEQGNLQGTGNLGGIAKSKTRKAANKSPCSSAGTGTRTNWSTCGQTNGNAPIQSVT